MSFWTAVVCIVAFGVVSEMYRARLKASSLHEKQRKFFEELSDRMTRIESRMASIETIVLEHEKRKQFDNSLGDA